MSEYVDDFRRTGHEVVDWVADFLENTRDYPFCPKSSPAS